MFYTINNHLYKKNNAFVGSAHIDFIRHLTLIQSNGGTITASNLTGHDGDTSNLSYTANQNYYFKNWSNTGGNIQGNTFTYGDGNASIKGNFVQMSITNYSAASANKAADYRTDGGLVRDSPLSACLPTAKVGNGTFAFKATISNSTPKDFVVFDFIAHGVSLYWDGTKYVQDSGAISNLIGGLTQFNQTKSADNLNTDCTIFYAFADSTFWNLGGTSPQIDYLYYNPDKCYLILANYNNFVGSSCYVNYRNFWSGDKTTIKYVFGGAREIAWGSKKHYQRPISAYVNGEFVLSGYNNHSFVPISATSTCGICSASGSGSNYKLVPCSGFRNIEFAQFTNQDDAGHW